MTYNNIEIFRKNNFKNQILIVDGQPGCGKSMFSKIIASMERVELVSYLFELEFICRLNYFKKIKKDAAVTMVQLLTDHKLYQSMMGREMNFRYSDVSSVFKDPNPLKYLLRIFQKGDQYITRKIKLAKPILNLTTHNILSVGEPLFLALKERLSIIEIVRHPLYMINQQFLNMENVINDSRDIQISIKDNDDQLPYYAYGWEKLFKSSNSIEKAIYTIQYITEQTNLSKKYLTNNFNNQILTIPFENFVLNPIPYLNKIEKLLSSKLTSKTKKVLIKQKVPRKKISDGIPLSIYKRYGWKPPVQGLTEKEELEKLKQFVITQGPNSKSLIVLDKICKEYEKKYFDFNKEIL